jgi:hypothetical protein
VTLGVSPAILVRGPLAFFSWDSRLYSRGNFVGLNPLALLDTIEAEVQEVRDGVCLKFKLLTMRAWFLPALVISIGFGLYQASAPIFAWGFLIAVLLANFGIVIWMLRVGLRHELQNYFERAG